jgi:hypothetical protein
MASVISDEWDPKRNNNKHARPVEFRSVKNAKVVRVSNAFYRGSHFDGVFELADVA